MSNPSIIPAAQHLAEANNVDWRTLSGSGDGGSVVERDVLTYLTRVMLGEAETDPTPEPLPEGTRAWPEAERRREATQAAFTAPIAAPKPPAEPEAEAGSPWTLEKPPEPKPTLPVSAAWEDSAAVVAEAAAESVPSEAVSDAPGTVDEPVSYKEYRAQEWTQAPVPAELPMPGVSETVYQAALAELETLKDRLETLEEERSRYAGELQQLSKLQETTELQKTEVAKVGALQSEVAQLKDQLAGAQAEAQRAQQLATINQDLEERLARARTFKKGAKIELERILAAKAALESQLVAPVAAAKKRPWWHRD